MEKFALPKTLFSEEDGLTEDDDLDASRKGLENMNFGTEEAGLSFSSNESFVSDPATPPDHSGSASPISPPISPPNATKSLDPSLSLNARNRSFSPAGKKKSTSVAGAGSDIPHNVQPLFNYIIWRVHQESDPASALDSFIFLSDNPAMRKYAQRFGIRMKTLSEIRYVIARETQDVRNRQAVQQKGIGSNGSSELVRPGSSRGNASVIQFPAESATATEPQNEGPHVVEDEDDEILLKRAPKGPAASMEVYTPQKKVAASSQPPSSPRGSASAGSRVVSRDAAPRGPNNRARGGGSGRGRGRGLAELQALSSPGPIDPNSFARPAPVRGRARGGRGLWMPT